MTETAGLANGVLVPQATTGAGAPAGVVIDADKAQTLAKLDASRLKINLAKTLKPLPEPGSVPSGQIKTDHMLVVSFDPAIGWSAPEIKPYGPIELDPMSSCFQYATASFEGMKAYLGPDGIPRLFRPKENMARLARSAERLALPPFDQDALLELLKKFIKVESRWIPAKEGHSLYIRPTLLGTRPALGVTASDYAMIYFIVTPWDRYFSSMTKGVSLLAVDESIRAWPGGTGGHKLAGNYCPTFNPQREANKKGYDQILWLFGEGDEKVVTEAGVMNFFVAVKREDGGIDVITPPLDGTILPGITRKSCIALIEKSALPHAPKDVQIHVHEKPIFIRDIAQWTSQGRVLEAFGVGTAAIIAPVGRIGYSGKDILIPEYEGLYGPIAKSLYQQLISIQSGRIEWEDWCVKCE